MKKHIKIALSLVLTLAMLISLVSVVSLPTAAANEVTIPTANEGGSVTTSVDFSGLTASGADVKADETVDAVTGIYDSFNVELQSHDWGTVLTSPGAQWGYVTIAVSAPAGEVISSITDVQVDYICNDSSSSSIIFEFSVDGVNYTAIGSASSQDGAGYVKRNFSLANLGISEYPLGNTGEAARVTTVYIRAKVNRNGGPWAASIYAMGVSVATRPVDFTTLESMVDFTTLTATNYSGDTFDDATIKDAGAQDVYKLQLHNGPVHNRTVAMGYGGNNQAQITLRIAAPEGMIIDRVDVNVAYWLNDTNGYIDIQYSVDGSNWASLTKLSADTSQSAVAVYSNNNIDMAALGLSELYLKVMPYRVGGPMTGSLETVSLKGTAVHNTDVDASLLDFNKMSGADNASTDSATILADTDAVSVNNLRLGGYYGTCASPSGYSGEGSFVQKFDLNGKLYPNLTYYLEYWFDGTVAEGNVSTMYVDISTDNANWTTIYTPTAKTDRLQSVSFSLSAYNSASTVYVRVRMLNFGGYHVAAVARSHVYGSGLIIAPDLENTVDFTTGPSYGANDVDNSAKLMADHANIYTAAGLTTDSVNGNVSATAKGGYTGLNCYYVQKLTTGSEDKVFAADPILELQYGMENGMITVQVSVDGGKAYLQVAQLTAATAKTTTEIPLTGYAGYSEIYVKIIITRYAGPSGAYVLSSTLSADVEEKVAFPFSHTIDFTQITTATEDRATAAQLMMEQGAYAVDNLITWSNYRMIAASQGNGGAGYYIHRYDAGDGFVFETDPVFTLDYRLTAASPQGYIKVEASFDGDPYVLLTTLTEATSNDAYDGKYKTVEIPLTGATNYQVVDIKVTMEHWGAPSCAAVEKSTVAGAAKRYTSGNFQSELDFSAMNRDETASSAVSTILSEGAFDASNVYLGGNNGIVATPGGNMGEGYVTLKLAAATNAGLSDVALSMDYWAYKQAATAGTIKVYVSLDNNTYTEIWSTTGSASASSVQSLNLPLESINGASAAYVKITMQHYGTYEEAALSKVSLTAQSTLLKGDLNKDDFLSQLDTDWMRNVLLGAKNKSVVKQDVNSDTSVDVADLVWLLRNMNNKEESEPKYMLNFGNPVLNETTSSPASTSGSVYTSTISGDGAGDYADETYGFIVLDGQNASMEFTMNVPTGGKVLLDLEEIHLRTDSSFSYRVYVNNALIYTRSYDPNSTGPNHCFFDVLSSALTGDTITVRIVNTSTQGVRFRRVWALPDVDLLSQAQNVLTPMKVAMMITDVPTASDISSISSYVEAYRRDGIYDIALCWEIQYMQWGDEGTRGQIDRLFEIAQQLDTPLYLGLNSWWGGSPRDGLDGNGGSWADLKYSQVTYDGSYALTTPNDYSNTTWYTMNNDDYNANRIARIKETIAYIQRRSAELAIENVDMPAIHLYTENEPYYWPLNWETGTDTGEYGDFNPATVADAAADGVTLNPADGLSEAEWNWLYENLHTYMAELGNAYLEGAGTNYITIQNGTVSYPTELLTENSYTHSMLQASMYAYGNGSNWYTDRRAWENHILDTIHFGGEFNRLLDATNDGKSGDGDLRALDYIIAYGSHANINCEAVGMNDNMAILPQYYAHGLDGMAIYNFFNVNVQDGYNCAEYDHSQIVNYAGTANNTSSYRGDYTNRQLRARYQMIAARADAERLFARYTNTDDQTYARAMALYNEARYGEAIKVLSAGLAKTSATPDFMVSGYGQLGEYPLYVSNTDGNAAIRLLEVTDTTVKFEFRDSAATSFDLTIDGAEGNYSMTGVDNVFTITKNAGGDHTASNGNVTFRVDYYHPLKRARTVTGMVRAYGDTYLSVYNEDAEFGPSHFYTFGFAGYDINNGGCTVTRDMFAAGTTTSVALSSLQVGDYVTLTLNENGEITNVAAQYYTVSGTASVTAATINLNTISNPTVSIAGSNVIIGGDTALTYNGKTSYLRDNPKLTSTIYIGTFTVRETAWGISVLGGTNLNGRTVTATLSVYHFEKYGSLRALSITA